MGSVAGSNLTVMVPAYNEGKSIEDTIRSIQNQTVPPDKIIVINDCSTDDTAARAQGLGVTVLTPPHNTGSKAGAQNFALATIDTEFSMAVDADTTLAPDAIAKLLEAIKEKGVAAACGYVVPRHVHTIWERGRYIEYLFSFSFYKEIQDYYEKPLISSGCFSVYRTEILKRHNGWPTRTLAEDMDITWSFYRAGYRVRFVPGACCFPVEPHNYAFMSKQLKRWSHGFMQNVRIHWRYIMKIGYLRMLIAVALWDATIASVAYLFILPLLVIIFRNPFFLLGYIIDFPAVLIPIILTAKHKKNLGRILASLPAFFILRTVNSFFMLEAFWTELIMKKKFTVYEKGH
jgi:cellulose synthase/poly-beta-1,6-N-acetylglucosamine synthase-like glycosyltransferase